MDFKIGFCRIETDKRIIFGEITEIYDTFILVIDFMPLAVEISIDKADIIDYKQINEEDIPPYE